MSIPIITIPAVRGSQWSDVEEYILRKLYPRMSAEAVSEYLPGRSATAIQRRARALGMRARTSLASWRTPEGVERLTELMDKHNDLETVALEVGAAKSTLYRWAQMYPEIREALQVAEEQPVVIEPEPKPRKCKPSKCARCVWAKLLVKSGSHVLCMWPECIKEGQL